MARRKGGPTRTPRDPDAVTGTKLLKRVFGLLRTLPVDDGGRDTAGNRTLGYAEYAALVLVAMFNPQLQSLRGLADASALKKVRRLVGGAGRVSLGSLSESVRVFDPEALRPLIAELTARAAATGAISAGGDRPRPDGTLPPAATLPDELAARLVAVDGSDLRLFPAIVERAAAGRSRAKLHLRFRVLPARPEGAVVADRADERAVLGEALEPDRVYLLDRGYESYRPLADIGAAGSRFICRVQERPAEVLEEVPVSPEGRRPACFPNGSCGSAARDRTYRPSGRGGGS